jgi:hypothetical protein
VWEEKLRGLKKELKAWEKNLSSPTSEKIHIQNSLDHLQHALEDSPPNQDSLTQEVVLQKSLHQAYRTEEDYWRVKSRNLWLQAGDKNTTFFHKQVEARKNFNTVTEINSQDQVIKDFEGIKKVAHSFFKDLFTAPEADPLDPMSYPLSSVPELVGNDENQKTDSPNKHARDKKSLKPNGARQSPWSGWVHNSVLQLLLAYY